MGRGWPLLAICLCACGPGTPAGQELTGTVSLYPGAYGPASAPDIELTLPLPAGEVATRAKAKPARDVLLRRGSAEPWARLSVQWVGQGDALIGQLEGPDLVAAYGAHLAKAGPREGFVTTRGAQRCGSREGWLQRHEISDGAQLVRLGPTTSNRGWALSWTCQHADGLLIVHLGGYGSLTEAAERWLTERCAAMTISER